jgi:hypothetical protein
MNEKDVTHGTPEGQNGNGGTGVKRDPVTGRIQAGSPPLNPAGRPRKGESLTEILRRILNEEAKDMKLVHAITGEEMPVKLKELLMRRWLERALVTGANETIVAIVNRLEGTPRQTVDLNTTEVIRYDPAKYQHATGLFKNSGQAVPTEIVAAFSEGQEVDPDAPLL